MDGDLGSAFVLAALPSFRTFRPYVLPFRPVVLPSILPFSRPLVRECLWLLVGCECRRGEEEIRKATDEVRDLHTNHKPYKDGRGGTLAHLHRVRRGLPVICSMRPTRRAPSQQHNLFQPPSLAWNGIRQEEGSTFPLPIFTHTVDLLLARTYVFPLSLPSSLPPTLFPSLMKNAPSQDPPNMPSGLFLLRMHAPTHLRTYVYLGRGLDFVSTAAGQFGDRQGVAGHGRRMVLFSHLTIFCCLSILRVERS